MPRTELRWSVIAFGVNICLENAVKPIDTVLYILQNIERRDLIAIYFGPPWGVEVRWGDLSILLEKKK